MCSVHVFEEIRPDVFLTEHQTLAIAKLHTHFKSHYWCVNHQNLAQAKTTCHNINTRCLKPAMHANSTISSLLMLWNSPLTCLLVAYIRKIVLLILWRATSRTAQLKSNPDSNRTTPQTSEIWNSLKYWK